jgi:transcriptional regulator with XRE-family HTH domain
MTIQELFITNLKGYRKAKNLSQLQLALRCDSSQTYISEIEMSKKFPSPDMIERIAGALGIESYFLFKNEPVPPTISLGQQPLALPRLNPSQKQNLVAHIHRAVEKIVEEY